MFGSFAIHVAGGATAPGAPTIGTATATSATTATVSFTQPTYNGGATITSYTATSSPGNITGTLSQAGSGTITVSGLTTGTAYTFTVTATNVAGTSAASSASNSITTYLAPANTVAPVVSGTAASGQTLSSTTGTWNGIPTPTFAYQWQYGSTNISGATSSTYTLDRTYLGETIRCVVTATNAVSAVSANSNSTSAVTGVLVNSSAPVLSGTATNGQTLSVTNGTYTGYPGVASVSYAWFRSNGVSIGTNSPSYALVEADEGFGIYCSVTATSSLGSITTSSNTSSTVQPYFVTNTYTVGTTSVTVPANAKNISITIRGTDGTPYVPAQRFASTYSYTDYSSALPYITGFTTSNISSYNGLQGDPCSVVTPPRSYPDSSCNHDYGNDTGGGPAYLIQNVEGYVYSKFRIYWVYTINLSQPWQGSAGGQINSLVGTGNFTTIAEAQAQTTGYEASYRYGSTNYYGPGGVGTASTAFTYYPSSTGTSDTHTASANGGSSFVTISYYV